MKAAAEQNGLTEFRRLWRRWTLTVELFARRRGARGRIAPREYEALHTELLASCRGLAGTGTETERPFFRALDQLVQPWLTPHTLEQADREILFDLFQRCREAGQRLGCWTWAHALRQRAGMLLGLLAAAAGVVVIAATSWLWMPVLGWLGDVWRAFWLVARHGGASQWWFAAVVGAVILIALFLIGRSARA